MIQTVIIEQCPKCQSENIVKNGRDYKGDQKYHCNDCNAYGTLHPQKGHSDETQRLARQFYLERVSMRGIARVLGIARQTLARWIEQWATQLPDLSETLEPFQPGDVLELDELWSFVAQKANKRWIWIALCRRTRQVVAFVIGDRSAATCQRLWDALPQAYRASHSFSDLWEAYQTVFPEATHQSVGKETGETAHVERWNNTLRQRLARFVRKTLSFSKADRFHEWVLRLFIHHYNLSVNM